MGLENRQMALIGAAQQMADLVGEVVIGLRAGAFSVDVG